MKESKINTAIALMTLGAAVLMTLALSFAIGKWSLHSSEHTLTIVFPSASGLSAQSEVKLAGAPIGRVKEIKLIPLDQQSQDPITGLYNSVAVIVEVSPTAQVQQECSATIRQDGIGLSPQYLLLTPGRNHQAKLLENGAVLQGESPLDLSGLVQTASNTMLKADALIDDMRPAMAQMKTLSETLNEHLPPFLGKTEQLVDNMNGFLSSISSPDDRDKLKRLINNLDLLAVKGGKTLDKADTTLDHLDPDLTQLKTLSETLNDHLPILLPKTERMVDHADGLVSSMGTPEQQEKIKKLITNLSVVSENLKVVSANAQALTATLAHEPWRLVWGGKTVQPPSAEEVLKSDNPVPIKDNFQSGH
jgi:ABC-type transporter Mla subunit MlaD